MRDYLLSQGLRQWKADPCIYYRPSKPFFVGIYVYDIITVEKDNSVQDFRRNMRNHFGITEGGLLEWYLGIWFNQENDGGITLDQEQDLKDKLKKYDSIIGPGAAATPIPIKYRKLLNDAMDDEIVKDFPYRQMVGSVMSAMIGTWPDLALAVSVVSKYIGRPTKTHCELVKQIFKYVRANPKVNYTTNQKGFHLGVLTCDSFWL